MGATSDLNSSLFKHGSLWKPTYYLLENRLLGCSDLSVERRNNVVQYNCVYVSVARGDGGGLVTFYTQMLHDSLPRGGEETEGQETIPPFLELRVKKLRNVGEVKDKT